jgi:hypothetical protein
MTMDWTRILVMGLVAGSVAGVAVLVGNLLFWNGLSDAEKRARPNVQKNISTIAMAIGICASMIVRFAYYG